MGGQGLKEIKLTMSMKAMVVAMVTQCLDDHDSLDNDRDGIFLPPADAAQEDWRRTAMIGYG